MTVKAVSATFCGGMTASPDIEALRRFAALDDRDISPFFAGRIFELKRLAARCEGVLETWRERGRVGGRSTVITGCPGMGKTSLLDRFEDVCNAAEDPASPLAFRMAAEDMTDASAIAGTLADAAREHPRVGAVMEALGADVASRLGAERTFEAARRAFFEDKAKARPICVLVDEAQCVAGDLHGATLRKLHKGDYKLPILPVFAGLGDTEDALADCGISRLSDEARMPLGLLSETDAGRAVEDMFRAYRIAGEADELAAWKAAIARDSGGFPQHLHIGMKAAAAALLETGGVARREGLGHARASASAARAAYYESRISPELGERGAALVGLVGEVERHDPLEIETLHALAARHLEAAGEVLSRAEAKAFVRRLVRSGLLQRKFEHTVGGVVRRLPAYEVPIPSMKTWILEDYAQRLGLADAEAANEPSM